MRKVPAQIASQLQNALPLIAGQGLEQTKIDEIADASGVPKATLYYYFSGKEEILAFLFEDMLTAIADQAAMAAGTEGTAKERLEAVVKTQIRLLVENPDLGAALIGDLGRVARTPTLIDALAQAFYAPVEGLMVEGNKDGSLREIHNPLLGSMSIFGSVIMSILVTVISPIAGPTVEDVEVPDDLAGDLLDVVMRGLQPEGS
ncbi:TetR/AcrR family transcriptional regulator [Marmoricola sp. OAE513]|uniref:TetR/AcrR family transcriptional regulator n=1 Tax=Marmoricola sp. OAE513 TaxID=2817894 RepID=UPI001AE525F3